MVKSAGSGAKHGKDIAVGPHKGDDRWAAHRQGNERVSGVTDTKKEAVNIGREYARQEHSELVIKGVNGQIQSKDSHDPEKSKG